jgi:uncharacterized protein (DUF1330 family)
MAKGYWIAHIDVREAEGYNAYSAAIAEPFRKFGGRYLVRGGAFEAMEGAGRARHVMVEFKDYATALACYHSPEYQKVLKLREGKSDIDLIVVEGCEGPQP